MSAELHASSVVAWKESMAKKLDTLQNKRRCKAVVPYPRGCNYNFPRCHFVFKIMVKGECGDMHKSRLVTVVCMYQV